MFPGGAQPFLFLLTNFHSKRPIRRGDVKEGMDFGFFISVSDVALVAVAIVAGATVVIGKFAIERYRRGGDKNTQNS
jgi:hypothetical protein